MTHGWNSTNRVLAGFSFETCCAENKEYSGVYPTKPFEPPFLRKACGSPAGVFNGGFPANGRKNISGVH